MTIGQFIDTSYPKKTGTFCSELPTHPSRLNKELILCHTLHCLREELYTRWDSPLNPQVLKTSQYLLQQSQKGQPLAYILGKKEFYGRSFYITPPVFIPRPETETLVLAALSVLKTDSPQLIIDLGCGSGCVGLSLLMERPKASLIGVDIHPVSHTLSQKNARLLGLTDRALFLNKNVRELNKKNWQKWKGGQAIDMIVANPPYIAFNDPRIDKQVVQFESAQALFSPKQGFYHIQSWLQKAYELLKPKGHYLFEIGKGQEKHLKKIFIPYKKKWHWMTEWKDLSGYIRVIHLRKKNG